MDFQIVVDDSFLSIFAEHEGDDCLNKHIMSIANDFEDGVWRYKKFKNYIWNNIAETALSKEERDNLVGKPSDILAKAAQNLRLIDKNAKKKIGEGSELAEILMYGLLKEHFDALSVVPKIFYKQNSQDTVKGADSVHVVLSEDKGDFTIWFGEAKFLNDISDARLKPIITSVKETLDTNKLKKENSIITGLSELKEIVNNDLVYDEIKKLLSQDASIDQLKPKLHIPILLLHECKITKEQNQITEEYIDEIKKYHFDRAKSYFEKQVEEISKDIFRYELITFHLILFPVPCKQTIVNQFVESVEFYKEG